MSQPGGGCPVSRRPVPTLSRMAADFCSATMRCSPSQGAEAAGWVPEAGDVLASCRLHLPVRAGRGFLNSGGGAGFAPLVEPPPEPAPRSGAKSRSRRRARSSWFRATRVQGSVVAGLGDAGAAACHAGLIWCRSPLRYRDFCRNPVKRTGHGWPRPRHGSLRAGSQWCLSGIDARPSGGSHHAPDPVTSSRRRCSPSALLAAGCGGDQQDATEEPEGTQADGVSEVTTSDGDDRPATTEQRDDRPAGRSS